MHALLSKPYRLAGKGVVAWRNAAGFGGFVFLFLGLFQPFGLSAPGGRIWPVALGYGVVCAGCMLLLNWLVPKVAPRFFSEPRWTVGREIGWTLLNVALIGLANWLYSSAIGLVRPDLAGMLRFGGFTLLVGSFPIAAGVLLNEARLSKRYRDGSDDLNARLPEQAPEAGPTPSVAVAAVPEDRRLTIPSELGRDDFTLPVRELLFIRSAGNYLEVHHLEGGQLARKVVRGSLKMVEASLAEWPRLLRCHKSYVVNLDRVVKVGGNAQGFHLCLDHGEERVPVSRSLNHRLETLVAVGP